MLHRSNLLLHGKDEAWIKLDLFAVSARTLPIYDKEPTCFTKREKIVVPDTPVIIDALIRLRNE
tara:strand:- start:4 stop:195 length:192 start_codon:yes stop_codon:yes gene_type:complete